MKKTLLAGVAALGMSVSGAQAVTFTNTTDVAIPDDGYNGTLASMASSTINVPGGLAPIQSVTVSFEMAHTWVGDLSIKLVAPSGTQLHLMSRPGMNEPADDGTVCCGNSADLIAGNIIRLDDAAANSVEGLGGLGTTDGLGRILSGTFRPFSAWNPLTLSDLIGEDPTGNWTLYVGDSVSADSGSILSWSVTLNEIPEPATIGLFGAGLAGLAWARRRRAAPASAQA